MAKDIFEADYFAKHRDISGMGAKDKQKIYKYLNVKHKPIVEEQIPIPEEETDEVFEKEVSSTSNKTYDSEFMKLTYAGLMGALLVFVYSFINYLGMSMTSWLFWKNVLIVILTGAIVFLVLGILRGLIFRR